MIERVSGFSLIRHSRSLEVGKGGYKDADEALEDYIREWRGRDRARSVRDETQSQFGLVGTPVCGRARRTGSPEPCFGDLGQSLGLHSSNLLTQSICPV